MKVIHVILGKARLDRMNGVNQVVHHLASHQAELGHATEVWGISPSVEEPLGDRSYCLRLFKAQKPSFLLGSALKQAINSLETEDIMVHLHAAFIPQFPMISRLLSKRGIPYVYSPHGNLSSGALRRSKKKKTYYLRFFELPMIKRSKGIHFLGQIQYDYFDRISKIPRKFLIPNGQDFSSLPSHPPNSDAPKGPVFSFCGRFDIDHKGLDLLLEGFNHYVWSGGKGHLSLIGDGPDREVMEGYIIENELGERVSFHGSVFGEKKYQLLSRSDVFVHTSRYEGMPCSVLEAAGMGLPCLLSPATNLDIPLEAVGGAIPLITNSPEGICKSLRTADVFWEEGALPQMGKRARALIHTHYQWDKIAVAFIEAYKGKRVKWPALKQFHGVAETKEN